MGIRVGLIIVVLSVGAWRADADPDRVRRARDLFQEAETAYSLGAYHQALEKFQHALKLVRRPSILLNIAQCHRQLGNREQALKHYRQYLSEWESFRPGIAPPYRQEVGQRIEELEAELRDDQGTVVVEPPAGEAALGGPSEADGAQQHAPARLALEGVPRGAQVLVNGERVGPAPQGETLQLKLEPGAHLVRVRAVGFAPWAQELRLASGQETRLFVALTPIRSSGSTPWLVAGITTSGLAVGAEVFAIISTVTANDSFRGSRRFERYQAMAIAGHVVAGASLIGAGVSWWMYYRSLKARPTAPLSAFSLVPARQGLSAGLTVRF